jgi:TRAP-type C4-dicarboxylate transport system permease small subunit
MPDKTDGLAQNGQNPVSFWLGKVPSHALGIVSCALLFLMMLVTFIDVGGRYLFSSPLPAAYELISLIMPGIIFCALPFVCHRESHVTIDLLDFLVSASARRWQGFLVSLFSTLAMGFITYRLYVRYFDHRRFGEVTDELFLPLWPFSLTMSILCGIATLALLANAYAYLTNRMPGSSEHEVPST